VINSALATSSALDRVRMAELLRRAGVPTPRTWAFDCIEDASALARELPIVIKSRISRRGDLVTLVRDTAELRALLPVWGGQAVLAQEFSPNDGYDIKCWVIGDHVAVARRPSALESRDTSRDIAIDPIDVPREWIEAARRAGAALGLDLFGADLLISNGRPVVIDVNAFPGFRGAPSLAPALVDFIECRIAGRRLSA
jgi:ribosomal protein S6--L-glutamate ligase